MAKSGPKRRTSTPQPAAPATPPRRAGDPQIFDPHWPLVCCCHNKPFPEALWTEEFEDRPADVFQFKTIRDAALMAAGFHPNCWLTREQAEAWQCLTYPLENTLESIGQWRSLIEMLANPENNRWRSATDATRNYDEYSAELAHDLALIENQQADSNPASEQQGEWIELHDDNLYRIGNGIPFSMDKRADRVLQQFADKNSMTTGELKESTSCDDISQIMKRLKEHPKTGPFVTLPNGKNAGGYHVKIRYFSPPNMHE